VYHKTKGGVGGFETICLPTGKQFYNGNAGMSRVELTENHNRKPIKDRINYVISLVQDTPRFFTCDEDLAQWYARSTAKTAVVPVVETFVLHLKLIQECNLIDIYAEENHAKIRDILKEDTSTLGKFNKSIAGITAERGWYRLSVYEDDYEISEALRAYFVKNDVPVDGFCCEKPNHMEYMFLNPKECFEQVTGENVCPITTWQRGELILPKQNDLAGTGIVQNGCLVAEAKLMDLTFKTTYMCTFNVPATIEKNLPTTLDPINNIMLGENDIRNYYTLANGQLALFASPVICQSNAVRLGAGAGGAAPLKPEQIQAWKDYNMNSTTATHDEQSEHLEDVF
jgi:hypothetical protein